MAGQHRSDETDRDMEARKAWLGGFVIGAGLMVLVWGIVLIAQWL